MIKSSLAAIRRVGRGDDTPLTSFATAILVVLVVVAIVRLATSIATGMIDDLKAVATVEAVGDVIEVAVILWAAFGVLRSVWRTTGKPNLWMSVAIAVAVGGVIAICAPKYLKLRETALIVTDHDPVGPPATIKVRKGEVIFDGAITAGAAERFLQAVDQAGAGARLVINSPGGRELEAMKIADEVERRKMPVHVSKSCESACTLILIASPDAVAAVYASIGFHQVTRDGSTAAGNAALSQSFKTFMLDAGIDAKFVDKALKQPPDDMWYPTDKELIDAGVVDRLDPVDTLGQHVKWLHDDNLPYQPEKSWLIVDATSAGSRLNLAFGFTPGSAMSRNPPSAIAQRQWSASALCKDEYYRALLDNGAAIAMTNVDNGVMTEIQKEDCPAG